MNVKEIIIAHLKSIGADGLCCDGCGCGLDDLMPCESNVLECVPAKRHDCDGGCSGCVSAGPHDRSDNCYRTFVLNESEETHL